MVSLSPTFIRAKLNECTNELQMWKTCSPTSPAGTQACPAGRNVTVRLSLKQAARHKLRRKQIDRWITGTDGRITWRRTKVKNFWIFGKINKFSNGLVICSQINDSWIQIGIKIRKIWFLHKLHGSWKDIKALVLKFLFDQERVGYQEVHCCFLLFPQLKMIVSKDEHLLAIFQNQVNQLIFQLVASCATNDHL